MIYTSLSGSRGIALSGTSYAFPMSCGSKGRLALSIRRSVDFARDSSGRISAVITRKDSGGAVVTLASSVAQMPFGSLESLVYGNGLSLSKTFTADYELDELLVEDNARVPVEQHAVLVEPEMRDLRDHRHAVEQGELVAQ